MTNETIDTDTAPTGSVSHSDTTPRHGLPRRRPRWGRLAVASTALLAGSITIATQVAANDEFENRCTPSGPGSADSIERQMMTCQAVLDDAYVACMRNAAGTPDSAERWVDYCQTQALG